jgi:hypothetical protein
MAVINTIPGAWIIIKHFFTDKINAAPQQARTFVIASHLHPSLIFVGKAGAPYKIPLKGKAPSFASKY